MSNSVLHGEVTGADPETGILAPGTPCPNCGVKLRGRWCYNCGQFGEDFHRSAWRLLLEAVEDIVHYEGRLWRTLPDLIAHPARLTRNYLDGHRVSQVPPLRLFIIPVLLIFVAGSVMKDVKVVTEMSPAERAELNLQIPDVRVAFGHENKAASHWLQTHLQRALNNPEEYKIILEGYAERFAILMLPLSAGLLSLIFILRRQFFMFDHLIFSMHSLAFQGFLLAAITVLGRVGFSAGFLFLASPVHLFFHMRGVYGTGVPGTLVRMVLLAVGSVIGFGLLVTLMLLVGLYAMGS